VFETEIKIMSPGLRSQAEKETSAGAEGKKKISIQPRSARPRKRTGEVPVFVHWGLRWGEQKKKGCRVGWMANLRARNS